MGSPYGPSMTAPESVGLLQMMQNQQSNDANIQGKQLNNQAARINLRTLDQMNQEKLTKLDFLNKQMKAISPYWGDQAKATLASTLAGTGLTNQQAASSAQARDIAQQMFDLKKQAFGKMMGSSSSEAQPTTLGSQFNPGTPGTPLVNAGQLMQPAGTQQLPTGQIGSTSPAIAVNSPQMTRLDTALNQPGIPQQRNSGLGSQPQQIAQPMQQEMQPVDNSPQAQQARDIKKAEDALPFFMVNNDARAGIQNLTSARNGTVAQRDAAANDAAQLKEYDLMADKGSQLKPLLARYEETLKKIPKTAFLPGARNLEVHTLSNMADLQDQSTVLMPLIGHLLGLSAKAMTNTEMSRLTKASLDPRQPYGALVNTIENLKNLTQRGIDNKKISHDWYDKHGKMNNFLPFVSADKTPIVDPNATVKVTKLSNGKNYTIAASRLNEYLSAVDEDKNSKTYQSKLYKVKE